MADFLLELLSEEIPARMQAKARNDLARMMAEALAAAGLSHDGITTYSTPRRLALIAKGLPLETAAVSEELKGPKAGAPQQALDGFLRKTGLSQEQLQDRGGTWFAVIDKPGRATAAVLAETVATIIRNFPWPKSMRWGAESGSTASLRWVRPLHSIVALLGDAIVPVAIDGVPGASSGKVGTGFPSDGATIIKAGAATLGHRFHHPGMITIGGAHDYVEKLRACHVLVDQAEREKIVRDGALGAAKKAGFALVEDEGLVVENAGLTEWPVPLLGSFDPDFLDVPPEVIQLTARTNQKYFVMRDGNGKLAPHFVCVANIDANDGGLGVIAGNERVLAARLSDARFFWQQDLKVPLGEQARKLAQIVFHEKLGTVADKVDRVAKLARWLVEEGIVKGAIADETERAARLAKADLVTGMVGEFPELQGVIGGHLARAQGEPDAIADAVRDHYKPVGQGDDVPTAPVTVAVSLADKLDTLTGFFAMKMPPTGSKDPFALRRAALGTIQLILENGLRLPLREVLEVAENFLSDSLNEAWEQWDTADFWDLYGKDHNYRQGEVDGRTWLFHAETPLVPLSESFAARQDLMNSMMAGLVDAQETIFPFVIDRLKVQQRESGVRHDLIDAVFAVGGVDDLSLLLDRVAALQAFLEAGDGPNLLAAYKRVANILKKEEWDPTVITVANFAGDEAAFDHALDLAEPEARAAVEAEDFTGAMSALASLRAPIDTFFDKVTVNADDVGVRARRLNLLARFRDAVHAVADFSKIEG